MEPEKNSVDLSIDGDKARSELSSMLHSAACVEVIRKSGDFIAAIKAANAAHTAAGLTEDNLSVLATFQAVRAQWKQLGEEDARYRRAVCRSAEYLNRC